MIPETDDLDELKRFVIREPHEGGTIDYIMVWTLDCGHRVIDRGMGEDYLGYLKREIPCYVCGMFTNERWSRVARGLRYENGVGGRY